MHSEKKNFQPRAGLGISEGSVSGSGTGPLDSESRDPILDLET